MIKFIYIKYGDLTLKGNNKDQFINCLYKNIKIALKEFEIKYIKQNDNIKIFYNMKNEEEIIKILKFIPGILYVIKAIETETNIEKIKLASSMHLSEKANFKTFKIEVKRVYKNFMESLEIKKQLAGHLLVNNNNLKVNVKNPDVELWVEIKKEKSIVYSEKIKGVSGFPIGINGSCLSLISGGIDSSVSSFLIQKKGIKIDYLTFITSEVTEKTIQKISNIINKITLNGKIQQSKLFIVDFTHIQNELAHAKDIKYRITLMRRSFYRIAEKIAKKYNIDALVSGDSLGQVASQTMESINTINNVMNEKIIFRPLLTYDKNEIIKIANEIDTYNISITYHEDICSLFAPKAPITKPNINKAIENEKTLDLLMLMEEKAVEKLKIIEYLGE